MKVRKINAGELLDCDRLAQVAFEGNRDLSRSPKEHFRYVTEHPQTKEQAYALEKWACFTNEGALMACLSGLPYQVYFDGRVQKMLGIAGVCTYPQHRRKGAVRACFDSVLREAFDKEYCFTYLYPFSEAFYGAFGYAPASRQCEYTYRMAALKVGRPEGSFHLYSGGDQELEAFEQAYDACACRYNMMVKRETFDWFPLTSADPFHGNRYAYLYRDASGNPRGYLRFHKASSKGEALMEVEEYLFDGPESFRALLYFAKTFEANYTMIRFKAPGHLPLMQGLSDEARYPSEQKLLLNGMVRVVSVTKALRAAVYQGTGEAVIAVNDPVLKENSGSYTVRFADNRCIELTAASREADIEMDIDVFSASITGAAAWKDFGWMDENKVRIHGNTQQLEKIFYHKPCWICDAF